MSFWNLFYIFFANIISTYPPFQKFGFIDEREL